MTLAQEMELKRMTPTMWEVLRKAAIEPPKTWGEWLRDNDRYIERGQFRSARILARRGFITLREEVQNAPPDISFTVPVLTEAGREALERQRTSAAG